MWANASFAWSNAKILSITGFIRLDRDGIRHRLEILHRPDGHALQPLLLHHHQWQSGFGLRQTREHADKGDGAADPRRPDGFIERADPAHLHDQVDAMAALLPGFFPHSGVAR